MSCPLAVVMDRYGVPSQTFVRQHVEALLPGHTAVVAKRVEAPAEGCDPSIPLLDLDRQQEGLGPRAWRALMRQTGRDPTWQSRRAVARFFREHDVQVVIGEHLDVALEFWPTARKLGLRFFGHAHGYDVSSLLLQDKWRQAYREFDQADGVITISRLTRDRLVNLGLKPDRVHLVPYGVSVPASPSIRDASSVVRCLAVGRMVEKKGPILLLDAFRRASEVQENLRLDFAGDGPLLVAAQQFVRCFGLESRVTLHGALSHMGVLALMREADIFLQHSIVASDGNEEGLPVVVLEAMAASLPVVSTRHAGIPDAVIEGETGFLVEEGDTALMAEHLLGLARHDSLRRSIGEAGWSRARTHFSWEQERSNLSELLGIDDHG